MSDVSFVRVNGTSSGPIAINLKCGAYVGCTNIQLQLVHIIPAVKTKTVVASCVNAHGTAVDTFPNVTAAQA
uniref:Uncharacterized protein n=1 Tax=Rhizophora mucronata TaxID=61149 RepID=A0A2P2JMX3_RHIMU